MKTRVIEEVDIGRKATVYFTSGVVIYGTIAGVENCYIFKTATSEVRACFTTVDMVVFDDLQPKNPKKWLFRG